LKPLDGSTPNNIDLAGLLTKFVNVTSRHLHLLNIIMDQCNRHDSANQETPLSTHLRQTPAASIWTKLQPHSHTALEPEIYRYVHSLTDELVQEIFQKLTVALFEPTKTLLRAWSPQKQPTNPYRLLAPLPDPALREALAILAKANRTTIDCVVLAKPFCEPPHAIQTQFDLSHDASYKDSIERLGVEDAIKTFRQQQLRERVRIAITEDFTMEVQNIVLTLRLRDPSPLQSPFLAVDTATATDDDTRRPPPFTPRPFSSSYYDNNSPDRDRFAADSQPLLPPPAANDDDGMRDYELNLNSLVLSMRNYGVQFNSKRFSSIIKRNTELMSSILLFYNGKLVSTGCNRIELALYQFHEFIAKLSPFLERPFVIEKPILQNIVSNGYFPNRICINLLAVRYPQYCARVRCFPTTQINDPERMGHRVILVFETGKVCQIGARCPNHIYEDMVFAYRLLYECQATKENEAEESRCRAFIQHQMGSNADRPNPVRPSS
jgi:TATA-box binding protein (TBP) (component of TFIID and TFIIIB)